MIYVQVHPVAEAELDALWESDPDSAATIAVLLDEMESCRDMAETLTSRGYRCIHDPAYEVKRFEAF
ncbi:hypothetical protein, partial [Collimonas silvisoli]|uniref:hypothetical protein n=1 Tax=Collimonas silvisoli TaxID=2825884 RepID=UPI001B8B4EF4